MVVERSIGIGMRHGHALAPASPAGASGRRRARATAGLVAIVATVFGCAGVQAVTSALVASGFAAPTDIAHAGDGTRRLFVAEQGGLIWSLDGGARAGAPFLDLAALVESSGERGLLGMAFHPDYRSNGRLFVDYTRRGDGATVIAEFRAGGTPGRIDPATQRVLLVIPQPFANHNGGALRFGPDGMLYVGMGDGGSGNDPDGRAQDPHDLLGKILRIDVDGSPYAIPPGNPFADGRAGRPEIWALGARNPWRFAFDRATGDFFIGDVGQGAWEEVDRFAAGSGAGANLGWRVVEGLHCTGLSGPVACQDPSLTRPIIEYGHDTGCSITGGTVYRGTAVPALAGRYLYADYCSGRIYSASADRSGAWSSRLLGVQGLGISTFGEDEDGEVYFADQATGEIRRLAAEVDDVVDVIEYYHAGFDHYFSTAAPTDIHALDAGLLKGWQRTGERFGTYATPRAPFDAVCRFYLPPSLGDTHFMSVSATECDAVRSRFPAAIEERPTFMSEALPAPDGECPAATVPVYRVWNRRADTNHRYTTSVALRDAMVAAGGVAEGYGADAVAMCAPL